MAFSCLIQATVSLNRDAAAISPGWRRGSIGGVGSAGMASRLGWASGWMQPACRTSRPSYPGRRPAPGPAYQPGTTGVLRVGMPARTDLSIFRCARTSSNGVNASHCRSDTSETRSARHNSRSRSVVLPVFSM
jgi:hypothetical protein